LKSLTDLLTTRDDKIVTDALLALSNFALYANYADDLRKHGGLQLSGRLLQSKVADIQLNSMLVLENYSKHGGSNVDTFHSLSAIPPLVALLNSSNQSVRNHSLATLSNLSDERSLEVIGAAGSLRPVITFLDSQDDISRINAVKILFGLSRNKVNKEAFRAANGISPLINLLASGDTETRDLSVLTLTNLSDSPANRKGIMENRGLYPILNLMGQSEINPAVLERVIWAVSNFAVDPDNHEVIRECGIEILLNLLAPTTDIKLLSLALKNILILSQHALNRQAIINAGGLDRLQQLQQLPNTTIQTAAGKAVAFLTTK